MRTTLTIDDDILNAARSIAAQKRIGIGTVISDLARKGLQPEPSIRYECDVPVFEVREDAPVFGPEDVRDALDEP